MFLIRHELGSSLSGSFKYQQISMQGICICIDISYRSYYIDIGLIPSLKIKRSNKLNWVEDDIKRNSRTHSIQVSCGYEKWEVTPKKVLLILLLLFYYEHITNSLSIRLLIQSKEKKRIHTRNLYTPFFNDHFSIESWRL